MGISCRSDVTEMLEKRVKSRFSYRRQLVLDPSSRDFDSKDEGPKAILTSLLRLAALDKADTGRKKFAAAFNRSIHTALGDEALTVQLQKACHLGEQALHLKKRKRSEADGPILSPDRRIDCFASH